MKRIKQNFKKGMVYILSLAMVAGIIPAMSGGANTVQAAATSGTSNTPSVSAYATKEQLMDGTFAPDPSTGEAANYGKLVFGKERVPEGGSYTYAPQEWYILGQDEGVSGDNTIIFAASPMEGTTFGSNNRYDDPNCNLRNTLRNMVTNNFTTAEQQLINETKVKTKEPHGEQEYVTTDRLYALAADGYGDSYQTIKAGSNNQTVLAMNSYWSNGDRFWLRSPDGDGRDDGALLAVSGSRVRDFIVNLEDGARPASNLNLSSVLFASSAKAASSGTVSGTITDGTAMTLRLDGTSRNIGAAIYNAEAGTIEVRNGGTFETVSLVVQGKGMVGGEEKDWYYSKRIDGPNGQVVVVPVTVSDIESMGITPSSIDLSACKIWLEITDPSDGMIYAVSADKEIEPINTTYVTKEQLMNSFQPYSDGTAVNVGKLVFGKKEHGDVQQWYILGKDTGVEGDNIIIFAESEIYSPVMFGYRSQQYDTAWGCTYPSDITMDNSKSVNINHYGASWLREELQRLATATDYFTQAEQNLMNLTEVTTKDTKYNADYTTTDKLYALAADGIGAKSIRAGTNNQTILDLETFWNNNDREFGLRSPDVSDVSKVLYIYSVNSAVSSNYCMAEYPVRPASNLNLSKVLFASAASAASSGTVSGTIPSGTAMTLRLDGSSKDIGTVTYNTTTDDIKAAKGSTEGNVALVVQGRGTVNGEEKDWYYSKQITGTETVNVSAIVSESNTPSSINLSDCNIWLETTDSTDKMIYAVGATEILSITSVEITGIEAPTANTTLDTEASCATTGVSSTTPQITWAPNHSTAGYNTSYTASITLTADTGYEFINSTTATVLGNNATSVNKNADGTTLTVTYDFPATAKRVIGSVTAPTVPANNTFTTYYGYDGYDASPISGSNSELGGAATVTFTDSVNPNTEAMNVTWTIESAGGVYDKTPGAENTFRWTIPASALTNYDASACQGYDSGTGNITGTVTITNKAATPVAITGTDSSVAYTGATIDVSPYFTIDSHAGTATYSLIPDTNEGTGVGSLNGSILTVTKTGTFQIKVETAANGIYGAGEKTITLTVANGTIQYTATEYSGTYDGQARSISVNVTNPVGTTITYSTDGTNYESTNPSFKDAGTYTVHYRIMKDNYDTITGSKTVTITPLTAELSWGDNAFIYNGNEQAPVAAVSNLISGDACTVTVTGGQTDANEAGAVYTAQATGLDNSNYKLPASGTTKEFTIRNASQTAPSLTGVNESIKGRADGKITGLTTDMEYRIATQSAFTAVTDADMTFAAGTYEVRYAAKPNYDASPAATVTISEGRMLAVTLPQAEEQNGYTLTAGKAQLAWKEGTTLTFDLAPGYSKLDHFAVKAVYTGSESNVGNVIIADNGDGTYTISDVTGDVKVTVEGVADVTAPTAEIKIGTNSWKQFWNTVTFGHFFKNTKTVTITASDRVTVSPTIKYYLSDDELTESEAQSNSITWTGYTAAFGIPANSKKIVYAKVTDEAGNTTIVNSDGMVVYTDSTPATTDLTYTYREGADKTVTVALNGNTVKEITDGTGAALTSGTDYTVSTDGTITLKASYLDTLSASDTAYTLMVTYNPLGVEYAAGEGSEAPAQTVISITCQACTHEGCETKTVKENEVAATCTKEGSYDEVVYCTVCSGKISTTHKTVEALGHTWDEGKVTKEPTQDTEGVKTFTCKRCGQQYTERIPKLPEENREENEKKEKVPFIKGENGKEGWDVIRSQVDNAKAGDTVTVDMNGTTVVPGNVISDIKGKDITIVFDMGGGITWRVNGQSVTADQLGDIDFSVKTGTNTIPVDIINNVTGERHTLQISLAHEGEFGFTAVLSVNMDARNAGLYANLFYYNVAAGKMEFICADEIAADGTAELTFTHASDYAIIIDTEPMDGSKEEENQTPKTGDTTPITWLFVIVLMSGAGLIVTGRRRVRKSS